MVYSKNPPFISRPEVWFLFPFFLAYSTLKSFKDFPFESYADAVLPLVFFISISFLIGRFLIPSIIPLRVRLIASRPNNSNSLRLVVILWLVICIVEIFLFGGLPLFKLGKSYSSFGISGIHGFANSIYLFLSINFFHQYRLKPTRSRLFSLLFLISWPFLVLSRGLLLLITAYFFSYLLYKFRFRTSIRNLIVALLTFLSVAFAFSYLFGALGQIRASDFSILKRLDFPSYSSPALAWIYTYLTSPLVNLYLTSQEYVPSYSFFPVATISSVFPNFLKGTLGFESGFDGYAAVRVASFLNASTAFRKPYIDFGVVGILAFGIFLGFLSFIVFLRSKRTGSLSELCMFNVLNSLSVFNFVIGSPAMILLLILLARHQADTNLDETSHSRPL